MTIRSLMFLLFLAAPVASAQSKTSPSGFLNRAGNSSRSIGVSQFLTSQFARQLIQVDDTHKGPGFTIKSLHLRRSGISDTPRATARKLRFAVRIGHGDRTKVSRSTQRLTDILVGSWLDAMTTKDIQLPDMTKRATQSPAPWSVTLPLDRPFVYNGRDGLFLHINAWDTGLTPGYPIDALNENISQSFGSAYAVGRGCKIGTVEMGVWSGMSVQSAGKNVSLGVYTCPIGPTGVAYGFVGGVNPNLPIPGICAPLLARPDIVIPLTRRIEKIVGQQRIQALQGSVFAPYSTSLVGIDLFAQAWSIDPFRSLPFIASHGYRTGKLPVRPVRQTAVFADFNARGGVGTFSQIGRFSEYQAYIIGLGT